MTAQYITITNTNDNRYNPYNSEARADFSHGNNRLSVASSQLSVWSHSILTYSASGRLKTENKKQKTENRNVKGGELL